MGNLRATVNVRRRVLLDVFARLNDAHNKHDAKALEAIYAPHVAFYGNTLTNKECAAKKAAAFEKSPDYAQSTSKVTFYPSDEAEQARGKTMVWFTKASIVGGKSADYPAALGVAPDGLVTFESDELTNQRMARGWFEAHNWCTLPGNAPNETLIEPFKVSAKSAFARVRRSKYFAELRSADTSAGLDLDDFVSCPYSCDRSEPRGRAYEMGIIDPDDRWRTEMLPP